MHAIETGSLRKRYPGGVEAVKGLDFEVAAGEVFGLLGPNGAGKSTTVGMLTTIAPTAGTARLAGHDVARSPLLARSVSSVVFQEPVVDRSLTGRGNLELHTRLWGIATDEARRRTAELVQVLGLAELVERPLSSYSGGERRRLEIACALTSRPQVLFLDEPTVGLDPRIRHELLDVIAGLRNREELTILLTTHYLDEAQRLCDRVAILHEGEIVALGSPQALLAGLGREILEFRVETNPEAALSCLRRRGVAGMDAFVVGSRLTVPLHEHTAPEALAVIEAERLRTSEIATRAPNSTTSTSSSPAQSPRRPLSQLRTKGPPHVRRRRTPHHPAPPGSPGRASRSARHPGAQARSADREQPPTGARPAARPRHARDGRGAVALALSALQIVVLIGLSALRGGSFGIAESGVAWFALAAVLFTVFMYGVAETLASRIANQEEYIGATPVVAILPFFLAGALFPIAAMPGFLTTIAKFMPLTHALAVMRYALVDPSGRGLHDIWGMSNPTVEAWLSIAVLTVFAAAMTAIAIRVFSRSAVS